MADKQSYGEFDFVVRLFEQFSIDIVRNQWSKSEGRQSNYVHSTNTDHKTRPNITFTETISKKCAFACWTLRFLLFSPHKLLCKWCKNTHTI